jgi:hypothetical protein
MASAPVISAALITAGTFRLPALRAGPMQTSSSANFTWSWFSSASE